MKLRNKKTGQTGYYLHTHRDYKNGRIKVAVLEDGKPFSEFKPYEPIYDYDSLADLNEEWEDYEEPNGWCITMYGGISRITKDDEELIPYLKEIGNYFNDKESAYDAFDKLKAWKRLKDKNFHFLKYSALGCGEIEFSLDFEDMDDEGEIGELQHDLDLLFGGEDGKSDN